MPLAIIVALIGLCGVLAGAVVTYLVTKKQIDSQLVMARQSAATETAVAKEKLQTENRLAIASYTAIRKLLEQTDWQMRSFGAIKHHLPGFPDGELRKLLVAAGAIRFTSEEGDELWGLLDRNEERLKPALTATGTEGGGAAPRNPALAKLRYINNPNPDQEF